MTFVRCPFCTAEFSLHFDNQRSQYHEPEIRVIDPADHRDHYSVGCTLIHFRMVLSNIVAIFHPDHLGNHYCNRYPPRIRRSLQEDGQQKEACQRAPYVANAGGDPGSGNIVI